MTIKQQQLGDKMKTLKLNIVLDPETILTRAIQRELLEMSHHEMMLAGIRRGISTLAKSLHEIEED